MLLLGTGLPVHTRLVVRLGEGPEVRSQVVWGGKALRTDLGVVNGHGIAFLRDLDVLVLREILRGGQRQRHPRLPSRLPIAYDHEGGSGIGTCLNLSEGGMFIETTDPVRTGQDLFLHVTPPGPLSALSLWGRVAWSNPVDDRNDFPSGMGVRFVEGGSIQVRQLSTLLNTLNPSSAHSGHTAS
ncbi:MAG: PilZ domain-containing protein [Candidatus Methylomirabilales bacterium]